MYRPKHLAEYAALRIVGGTSNALPQPAALGLGSLYAWASLRLMPAKRKRARRRVQQVLGDQLSTQEVDQVVEGAFRDLVWHTIEVLRTRKVSRDWIEKNTVFDSSDIAKLDDALGLNRGVIIAVPHLANWDLAGIGMEQLGYPMTFIMRRQNNPLLDQYLNRLRQQVGSDVIERDDPMLLRKAIRALKAGRVIAILVDLRARQPDLQVPFLGSIADLSRGVGIMSHMANSPVLPAFTTRLPDGRHQWHFRDAVMPDRTVPRNDDAERIVKEILPPLESAIRSWPDQYFWFNKRWVLERLPNAGADSGL